MSTKTNLPIPNTAILEGGEAVRLDKTDQQWIINDLNWKEKNKGLLSSNPHAFAHEEWARLREKLWQMNSRKIDRIEFREIAPKGLSLGIRNLIRLSYNDAKKIACGSQWYTYLALWEWSSTLFSSKKQDDFYSKFGKDAYLKRINKVRTACGFSLIED